MKSPDIFPLFSYHPGEEYEFPICVLRENIFSFSFYLLPHFILSLSLSLSLSPPPPSLASGGVIFRPIGGRAVSLAPIPVPPPPPRKKAAASYRDKGNAGTADAGPAANVPRSSGRMI